MGAAGPIDLAGSYMLVSGTVVVARNKNTVQIGSESPRSLLLHHAPADAVGILRRLDGTSAVGDVLHRNHADAGVWGEVLGRLRDAQLLVPAVEWAFPGVTTRPLLEPERDSLIHLHGLATARRVLQARQDAVVVVRGSGRVATAVASALAFSGLGHVHQQPDRALRLADLSDFRSTGPPATRDDAAGGLNRREPRPAGERSASAIGSPTRADASLLADNLRRAVPTVNVHAPAAHHRVSLVVLAGEGPPAPSLAAELTSQRIPHLAVSAGLSSAVVGPFVLPGRSSCLVCALRQRTELDSGRPALEEGLRRQLVVPPTRLVCAATALAVADTLDHLDGMTEPSTVDGTVEWQLGELAPRRRSWAVHPDCGCCTVAPTTTNG